MAASELSVEALASAEGQVMVVGYKATGEVVRTQAVKCSFCGEKANCSSATGWATTSGSCVT